MDINAKEIINRVDDITTNYSRLYQLNDSIYLVANQKLYQLTENLMLKNGIPWLNGIFEMTEYGNYYLAIHQYHVDNQPGPPTFEIRVYNKNFTYLKTLIQSPNDMMISKNNDGELLVSVKDSDVYLYVYNQNLIKQNEYRIGNFNNYPVLSVHEYKDYYFIKYISNFDHLVYNYTVIYDKAFNRTNDCLFVSKEITRKYIFVTDNGIVVTNNEKLYKINEDDYFKSEHTWTFQEPIKDNHLFYLAVLIYPTLCITRISFKRKN